MVAKEIGTALAVLSNGRVSVPLRGNGCERRAIHALDKAKKTVSVPLRGNGCESVQVFFIDHVTSVLFPSPCGVMVAKEARPMQGRSGSIMVSVPLRGNGCESSQLNA